MGPTKSSKAPHLLSQAQIFPDSHRQGVKRTYCFVFPIHFLEQNQCILDALSTLKKPSSIRKRPKYTPEQIYPKKLPPNPPPSNTKPPNISPPIQSPATTPSTIKPSPPPTSLLQSLSNTSHPLWNLPKAHHKELYPGLQWLVMLSTKLTHHWTPLLAWSRPWKELSYGLRWHLVLLDKAMATAWNLITQTHLWN